MTRVGRAQVLAYRAAAQGLHRDARTVADLAVLDIGVQEAMGSRAALAFAARLPADVDLSPGSPAVGPGHRLAMAWSLRGAPHVHRRADLNALAAAMWPLSEADAGVRLNESGPAVKKAGIAALEQFTLAVTELRASVPRPTEKGAASSEVTTRLPKAMRRPCRTCKTSHISDSAMRVASLPAGIELEPDSSPPVLHRRKGARQPKETDGAALRTFALSYLALLGPASVADFAAYLGARSADVSAHWPDGLAELTVDGRKVAMPEDRLDALRDAPEPDLVRLLSPFDPFMQARDRDLLVPDKSVHKAMWPMMGRPGVLFVDGEVAGVWRTKSAGKKLTVTVDAFGPLPKRVWTAVDTEAQRVAEVRGSNDVRVTRKD